MATAMASGLGSCLSSFCSGSSSRTALLTVPSQSHPCATTPLIRAALQKPNEQRQARPQQADKQCIRTNALEGEECTRASPLRSLKGPLISLLAAWQALAPMGDFVPLSPAEAVLNSPNTKIPRNPDIALRRSIPALNPPTRKMADLIEELTFLLRIPQRKPYGTMSRNVKEAQEIAIKQKDIILGAVTPDKRAQAEIAYEGLMTGKGSFGALLQTFDDENPDAASFRIQNVLENIATIELLQAPGLPYTVPAQYRNLPRLNGRAIVEVQFKRGDGSTFVVKEGGGPQEGARVEIVLDGYSAPITAGNFADLVAKKAYDGTALINSPSSFSLLSQPNLKEAADRQIPLEIMVAGEFEPEYRTTLDVQGGEIPVLPISVYGAVAMAHDPTSDSNSSASQFFFYLYDRKSAGLGGLSFDEGNFAVFGYVTKGKEVLAQLRTGDVISSARIIDGAQRLIAPST